MRVKRHTFQYYRSTGKRVVHLVEEELGGKTRAFLKKNPSSEACLLAPVRDPWKYDGVKVEPWEWMFAYATVR